MTETRLFIELKITNPSFSNHTYDVWSYVYKGPNSYSGGRESNKITIDLVSQDSVIIVLKNNIENISGGEYKLKIKILRDDRKTSDELTEELFIHDKSKLILTEEQQLELSAPNTMVKTNELIKSGFARPMPTTNVIYESSSEKMKNTTLFLVVFASLLILIAWFKIN